MPNDLELSQVRLRLTTDKDALRALRARKQFKQDNDGDYYSVMFNSVELKFRPKTGDIKTLGKSIAESIFRRSFVIDKRGEQGEDLVAIAFPIFEVVEEVDLGKVMNDAVSNKFVCPVPNCHKEMKNAGSLGHHLMHGHPELKQSTADEDEDGEVMDDADVDLGGDVKDE